MVKPSTTSSNTTHVLAYVFATSAILVCAGILIIIWHRKMKRRNRRRSAEATVIIERPHHGQVHASGHATGAKITRAGWGFPTFDPCFLPELTQHFAEHLGSGSCSTVYRGHLSSAVALPCAWKVLEVNRPTSNVLALLAPLFHCRHPNIAPLYAATATTDKDTTSVVLALPLMKTGTLRQHLRNNTVQTWSSRVQVATSICQGLLCLHNRNIPIIHGNLTSNNVFINNHTKPNNRTHTHARISDFGLGRFTRINPLSKTGYFVPEQQFSVASDVYQLGIIFLELFTGIPPSWAQRSNESLPGHMDTSFAEDTQTLCELCWSTSEPMRNALVDKRVQQEEEEDVNPQKLLLLGLLCTSQEAEQRPTINYILDTLLDKQPNSPRTEPSGPLLQPPTANIRTPLNTDPILDDTLEHSVSTLNSTLAGRACVICVERVCSVLFIPCAHNVCCAQCASLLMTRAPPVGQHCPLCRNHILQIEHAVFGATFGVHGNSSILTERFDRIPEADEDDEPNTTTQYYTSDENDTTDVNHSVFNNSILGSPHRIPPPLGAHDDSDLETEVESGSLLGSPSLYPTRRRNLGGGLHSPRALVLGSP